MTVRYLAGEALGRLASWLKYGSPPPECARVDDAGVRCGYVASTGVHEPASECAGACVSDPSRAPEHHAFVDPRRWRRLVGRANFARR